MKQSKDQACALALVGIEKLWSEVQRTPFVQRDLDAPIDRLPDIGESAIAARSSRAADALVILDRVQSSDLPHDLALTHAVAQSTARRMAQEANRYWLVFDPLGVGFFALFAPTAYGGGFLLATISGMLSKQRFETLGDLDRYLGLVEDYARLIDQMCERTAGQALRGVRIPQVQLSQSVRLINAFRASAHGIVPSKDRLAAIGADAAVRKIAARIEGSIDPALHACSSCSKTPIINEPRLIRLEYHNIWVANRSTAIWYMITRPWIFRLSRFIPRGWPELPTYVMKCRYCSNRLNLRALRNNISQVSLAIRHGVRKVRMRYARSFVGTLTV